MENVLLPILAYDRSLKGLFKNSWQLISSLTILNLLNQSTIQSTLTTFISRVVGGAIDKQWLRDPFCSGLWYFVSVLGGLLQVLTSFEIGVVRLVSRSVKHLSLILSICIFLFLFFSFFFSFLLLSITGILHLEKCRPQVSSFTAYR